jgi:hypothetical protein
MNAFGSTLEQYAEAYADFHEIPAEHVRVVVDGPDEENVFTVRLDSYEHPACETETYRLTADGTAVKDAADVE